VSIFVTGDGGDLDMCQRDYIQVQWRYLQVQGQTRQNRQGRERATTQDQEMMTAPVLGH